MKYINFKYNRQNETIDECETKKEALHLLREYQLSGGQYWISNKKCKNWD